LQGSHTVYKSGAGSCLSNSETLEKQIIVPNVPHMCLCFFETLPQTKFIFPQLSCLHPSPKKQCLLKDNFVKHLWRKLQSLPSNNTFGQLLVLFCITKQPQWPMSIY